MRLSKTLVPFAFMLVMGFGAKSALGQASNVRLTVNVSNPAAVTFTATGNSSLVNDASFTAYDGVELIGFFTGAPVGGTSGGMSGSLAPVDSASPYDFWLNDNRFGGSSLIDLNLYKGDESAGIQTFSTEMAAFTGIGTIDFSRDLGSSLPSPGSYGDIIPGYYNQTPTPVIGQWQVIPEPSTGLLVIFGGGSALFAVCRNRRRNDAKGL